MRQALLQRCVLGLTLILAANGATADDNTNRFARDIKILTHWFEGEFDNEKQRWFEADPRAGIGEQERQKRARNAHWFTPSTMSILDVWASILRALGPTATARVMNLGSP